MGSAPVIGSILLASTDADRLRAWYERAFGVTADVDSFLRLGEVGLLVDERDDVAPTAEEPGRVLVNLHVDDARATARHLDGIGVSWVAAVEYREQAGAWFGTLLDADGNYVQIIEVTDAYWTARRTRHGHTDASPLAGGSVATRLPAQDLDRARRFYAEKLGLEPTETRPGGLRYQCAGGTFSVFRSAGRASGEHTQMGWHVKDVDAVVAELRRRGVVFEEVEIPGLRAGGGIVDVAGNYPSAGGGGERVAWFRDSEGNLHGVGQTIP